MAECGIVPLEPAIETNRPVLAGHHHRVGRARRHRVFNPSRIIVTPADPRDGPQGPAARGRVQGCPAQELAALDSRFRACEETGRDRVTIVTPRLTFN
jgi:hypothetical protein